MSVSLTMGWFWDCPSCGNRNLSYGDFEPDEATLEDAREYFQDQSIAPGDLGCLPDEVVCSKCCAVHQVEQPQDEEA